MAKKIEKKKTTVTTKKKIVSKAKETTPKIKAKKVVPEKIKSEEVDISNLSREKLISKFATHEGDTGSPEVQIALFSQRIVQLSEHLKKNRKDNHSRRGLFQIIGKRRRLLQFIENKDKERYQELIKKLGLKK